MRHPISRVGALVAALALVVTGCSSSGGSSPTTASQPGTTAAAPTTAAGTPPTSDSPAATLSADQLGALADAAAAKAGGAVTLPKITIGYLRYVGQSPADQRIYNAAVAAAKVLGWKVIPCDGQGDPVKMAACADTLLNQHINVMLNDGIPEGIIAAALRRAKSMNIPVVYSGGSLDQTDLYTAGYVPPDGQMGQVLAAYVKQQVAGKSGGVIVQGFAASWGVERVAALKAAGVKIVSNQEADATNLVQGTQQQISAQLNQHPDASAVWITFETAVLGASQALDAKFPGKSYPDRPLLVTFYANLPTLKLISEGKVDAAIEDSLEWSSWVAMDQIAEFVARKTPMSSEVRPDYGPGLDFWRPVLVTKSNLPASGSLAPAPVDYTTFFQDKWKTEFGAAS